MLKPSHFSNVQAVKILNQQLQSFPESRCALSLLGYCYYHMQDFGNAADTYGQLVRVVPEVDEYKIYLVQSLIKAGATEIGARCLGNEACTRKLHRLAPAWRPRNTPRES